MKTTNTAVIRAARALIAVLFLIAGIRKLLAWNATTAYFSALGIPFPELALPVTILIELGGAIALIAGWRIRAVAWGMAVFTFGSALIAHRFWLADPVTFGNQLNHFLKNLAIAGGFLLLAQSAPPVEQRDAS
ncbi:DoxX family protein [Cupriavidus sp. CV2]|uniref:DoxX family protein n=1 Tax=Cupriavidus ulmosensis TaxID=3065913 RepID=UPI00296AAA19|nr:DoxX family protein [Cupriavidus sp. CV2]MDW3683705.1 DoxX family protein [Cupriavidus sp. CV2]